LRGENRTGLSLQGEFCRTSIQRRAPGSRPVTDRLASVTAQDLERDFGIARDAETVDMTDKGQVFLQREILGRATPFAALIRDGRLDGLVERQELARKVADKALAQLG